MMRKEGICPQVQAGLRSRDQGGCGRLRRRIRQVVKVRRSGGREWSRQADRRIHCSVQSGSLLDKTGDGRWEMGEKYKQGRRRGAARGPGPQGRLYAEEGATIISTTGTVQHSKQRKRRRFERRPVVGGDE